MSDHLMSSASELLQFLSTVPGCDVWSPTEAKYGRELESSGYARIVKARERVPGHLQQPYFGIKITAKGRAAITKTTGGAA